MPTDDAIPLLLQSLRDPHAEARASALIALAEIKTGVPGGPLLPLLRDPDEAVRAAAAFALSKVGDAAAIPELLAAWNGTASREQHLRRQLLIALGDVGGVTAIEPILGSLALLSPELTELALDFVDSEPEPERHALLSRLLGQDLSREQRAAIEEMLAAER